MRPALLLAVLTAFACTKPTPDAADAQPTTTVAQTCKVAVNVDSKGFSPSAVTFEQGKPATLVFTRTSDDTCAKAVKFPDLNVTKELPLNTPVSLDVPTDSARTLKFTCGMGMFESTVVVK